ncbi:response regulator [Mammaliicoccus stepanovicii]|uniref:response regulator n=1 Tax=Mammaliicoccus stepanovicii TaxID=643214 RepID=UPI001F0C73E5|nr:response regulator [Mammaliicoccus stepanovicii]
MFELNEFSVDTAKNGKEGLELFEKHQYDLVFIDKRMPGLTGEEVIIKVRELDKEVPIYMISAFQTSIDLETITNENITGMLMKPFSIDEVMKIARKHLG